MQPLDISANVNRLKKIAILYGGYSAERDISLQSGQAAIAALQRLGVEVIAIDTQDSVKTLAKLQSPECEDIAGAFIALHGVGGEDGKIQGVLESLNIPYTGSGILASSLCMDKLRTKQLWSGIGLPSAKYVALNEQTDWQATIQLLNNDAMVKPTYEGSSIGMSRVQTAEALEKAYYEAAQYDASVLAEQFIVGAEYTVTVLNGQALPAIRLQANGAFYDYHAKYVASDTQYHCPCGLSDEREDELKKLAVDAFDAVDGCGWGRVDFMANEQGEFYLLEINTSPGLTTHSLVPMAAKADCIEFDELILRIALQVFGKK